MNRKLINGKPAWQYWSELRRRSAPIKRTPIKRKMIKKSTEPNLATPTQQWYFDRISECNFLCAECKTNVFYPVLGYQIAVQAHILPKSIFKSVALHPLNCMCLGTDCSHHGRYDTSWDDASKMKIWPHAREIIVTVLIPLLPKHEYAKLPDILKDEYESRVGRY